MNNNMEMIKKWYSFTGEELDVVVNTQIHLSRNLKDIPFVRRMRLADRKKVLDLVLQAVENDNLSLKSFFLYVSLENLSKAEAVSFVERGLLTPEYISRRDGRGMLISNDESISIILNDEDHLQIHVCRPGLDLEGAYEAADRLERILSRALVFAFDEKFGFLTQNPADLGTGMHASLTLHLPCLFSNGAVPRIASSLSRLAIDLREGTEWEGKASLYRLTNRVSLGISEEEALYNLRSMALQVVSQERNARRTAAQQLSAEDTAYRALGLLSSARILTYAECMELLSSVRLAVSQGYYTAPSYMDIAQCMILVQPATLSLLRKEGESVSLDQLRASLVREMLQNK